MNGSEKLKKYVVCLLILCGLFLTGCGKYGDKDIIRDLNKKIEKTNGYYLDGELQIINNEDSYVYDVEVSYAKENNFRVSLKNKANNHEQIILKNNDGVYVLTPSLNKSFKFQSNWPYNNSQIYILQTILKDLDSDSNRKFEETKDGYIFTTKVNYANNSNFIKQRILIDKNLDVNEVIILNSDDVPQMKMRFNNIDYKATFDDTYFSLKGNMPSVTAETTSKKLDTIIYPMYIPRNTQLSGQEKVTTESGERIILTFSGDNSFMLVQEQASASKDLLTIPMYGEPYVITDTVGALSNNSVTWCTGGVEFYVVSDKLTQQELLEIANSINAVTVSK